MAKSTVERADDTGASAEANSVSPRKDKIERREIKGGIPYTVAPELSAAIDPGGPVRQVASVDELTLGEYIRLLQQPDRWAQLGLAVDRVLFCKDLDAVRDIRNNVTHFDPDGITSEEIDRLRDFKSLLKTLEDIAR